MVTLSKKPEHRSTTALGPPPHDLSPLPSATIAEGDVWFREHGLRPGAPDVGAWYHASWPDRRKIPGGRFDLAPPEGTCYLASTEISAARERVGRQLSDAKPISADHVSGRTVSTLELPALVGPIGDLCHTDALTTARVTAEIHTIPNYRLTAQWAARALADGFGGLHYMPRYSAPGTATAIALFGPTGAHPSRGHVSTRPLTDVLTEHGIDYDPIPSTATTTAIPAVVDDDAEPDPA